MMTRQRNKCEGGFPQGTLYQQYSPGLSRSALVVWEQRGVAFVPRCAISGRYFEGRYTASESRRINEAVKEWTEPLTPREFFELGTAVVADTREILSRYGCGGVQ